jgi:hypothetical protein
MHLNLTLNHIIRRSKDILSRMRDLSYCHIFQELNVIINRLSKRVLNALVNLFDALLLYEMNISMYLLHDVV